MTEHSNHGKLIWRYTELDKKYNSPHFLDRLGTISNLIIQPIGHVVFWITFLAFPSLYVYFGGQLNPSVFTLIVYVLSSLQVLWGCYTSWIEVLEYHQLSTTLMIWKLLTLCLRVPIITIHSKNTNHQLFKWAAGASFLFNNV